MIKFTVVVVTYANRAHLLLEVLSAAIEAGCDHIIIIDNGSSEDSKEKIRKFVNSANGLEIKIICNNKNEGSAIAFSQGMDAAINDNNTNDHILFLDDDNYPVTGAIQNSLSIATNDRSSNAVYFLMREDRPHYREYLKTRDVSTLLGANNSFMGFTLKNYFRRNFTKNSFKKSKEHVPNHDSNNVAVPIPCGPYGGMLTTKTILKQDIRPMKEMILYFDDTKYTVDLSKKGVRLYLLPGCMIRDIDDSWSAKKTSKFSSPVFEADDFKIEYSFRNRIFFERNVILTNKFVYFVNMTAYLTILFVKALISGNIRKYVKLIGYIRSGFNFGN